ncbi:hypothetical protein [Dankookia rubra]|nr:hypothetical protein [Dankookia rubra]
MAEKRVSRESIDELRRAPAVQTLMKVDAGTFIRTMRNADDEV